MLFRRLNWNVVGWFRTVSTISYVLIGLGIAFMAYNWVTTGAPLKLGLSFTGGTDITIRYAQPITRDQLAAALPAAGITDAKINSLAPHAGEPAGERWTIETQKDFGDQQGPLNKALTGVAPVYQAPLAKGVKATAQNTPPLGSDSSVSTVGPSLSHEYLKNALIALVIAIAIQFLYIAFRFGWNLIFGWVCVVALVRDALMMIGIYAIAGRRVDDAFLAAVLTVVGYSIMDTIVILDRIRENTKLLAGRPVDQIVNTSILQTMTRSVNTLATVIITLVALVAFGGASLQNFAFALLVGVCSGGYHSIFFSAPLVAVLQKRSNERRAARGLAESNARTVAGARAAGSGPARNRDSVVEARRARREREKSTASKRLSQSQPARYKRQQQDVDLSVYENRNFGVPERREDDTEMMDPLDAQALGLHDDAADIGHEAIHLDLGDDLAPTHLEDGTPVVPESKPIL
jgi:preprotein translocase SecF subunit